MKVYNFNRAGVSTPSVTRVRKVRFRNNHPDFRKMKVDIFVPENTDPLTFAFATSQQYRGVPWRWSEENTIYNTKFSWKEIR